MRDISNKTIVTLLLIALAITIAGTVVSLSKLNQLDSLFNAITGAPIAQNYGYTNITITTVTSFGLSNGTTIDFGSGAVNTSCNFCIMDSNGINSSMYTNSSETTNTGGLCCRFSDVVGFSGPGNVGFILENTGNVNISVGYTCSGGNCTHGTFIGGSRNSNMSGLEIKVTSNSVAAQSGESGSADSSLSCVGGGAYYRSSSWNITNSSAYTSCAGDGGVVRNGNCTGTPEARYTALSSSGHWLCGNYTHYQLAPDANFDAGIVDINITIPANATATSARTSFTLTFNATSSG